MPTPWFDRCRPPCGFWRTPVQALIRGWGAVPGTRAMLATVVGALVMIALGVWQLDRFTWTNALIARIHARIATPTVPLPARLGDPQALEYRHVTVTGTFLHDHELYLVARSRFGNDGLEVVTPLVRADGGGVVLVNRGWIPKERRPPGSRRAGLPEGTVTIEGVAELPPRHPWFRAGNLFLAENRPDLNQWLYIDPPAMAAAAAIAPGTPLAAVIIDAGPDYNPGGLPVGGQTVIDPPNDHLLYAVIWFGLAVIIIFVYVVAYRQLGPRNR